MSKKGVAIQMKPFDHEFCLRNVFFHKARQRVIVPSHDQLGIRRKVHGQLPPSAETKFREEIAPIFNKALEGIKAIDLLLRYCAVGCVWFPLRFLAGI